MNDSALFRQLLDNLPDAVFFKDAKGRFLRINRVLAEWYGLKDPAKAVGKTEADFVSPGFARATLEIEQSLMETGVPLLDQEERFVGRDGKTRWVSTTKLPLRRGKRIVGTMGISRDIRGVKRAEEKARDSDALYQSLIESLPQCIFRKDLDGRYVYVNQRLCDLHGVPRNPKRPGHFSNYGLSPVDDEKLTAWMRENLRLSVWRKLPQSARNRASKQAETRDDSHGLRWPV